MPPWSLMFNRTASIIFPPTLSKKMSMPSGKYLESIRKQ
jgi:hypothetical protein